jgi:hypothetical protein
VTTTSIPLAYEGGVFTLVLLLVVFLMAGALHAFVLSCLPLRRAKREVKEEYTMHGPRRSCGITIPS